MKFENWVAKLIGDTGFENRYRKLGLKIGFKNRVESRRFKIGLKNRIIKSSISNNRPRRQSCLTFGSSQSPWSISINSRR